MSDETWNPDGEDLPNESAEGEEWTEDPWAAHGERARARWEHRRPRGQAEPWVTANAGERRRAAEAVVAYRADPTTSLEALAAQLGCRVRVAREARWLALISGTLLRISGGGYAPRERDHQGERSD